jgi:hypothetical protein
MNQVNCLLIGVAGFPGAGKDAFCEAVLKNSFNLRKYKFAYPIQDLTAELAGIESFDNSHRNLFENREWKETFPLLTIDGKVWTPRKTMQTIGQGFRDMFGQSIWSNKAQEYASILSGEVICYFTDMRYHNEFQFIRDNGGITIFIDRPEAEQAALSSEVFNHASEMFVPEMKHRSMMRVDNSRDLDALVFQANEFSGLLTANNPCETGSRLKGNLVVQEQLINTFNANCSYYFKSRDKENA